MSIRQSYEAYLARREALTAAPMSDIWMDQESRYVHPFQLYGNVWYVGDSWVCVHLVDTGDGLLLIDSGNCGATAMLVNAIWEAGFNPADVKWIIHSHTTTVTAYLSRITRSKTATCSPSAALS